MTAATSSSAHMNGLGDPWNATPKATRSAFTSTSAAPVPWDEQVVPALRKRLEEESARLGRRISGLDDASSGQNGWDSSTVVGSSSSGDVFTAGNRQQQQQQQPRARGMAAEAPSLTASRTADMIYATPSRSASARYASSSQASGSSSPSYQLDSSPTKSDTQKARDMARAIKQRRLEASGASRSSSSTPPVDSDQSTYTLAPSTMSGQRLNSPPSQNPPGQQRIQAASSSLLRSSRSDLQLAYSPVSSPQSEPPSPIPSRESSAAGGRSDSPGNSKKKTKMTPRQLARIKAEEANRRDREQDSLAAAAQRNAVGPSAVPASVAIGSKARDSPRRQLDYGEGLEPRRPSDGPDNVKFTASNAGPSHAPRDRAGSVPLLNSNDPSTSTRTRAVTDPSSGFQRDLDLEWDEVLPPVVARKLAQEELLARDPGIKDVEKLIEEWDPRNGLPMSQKEMQRLAQERLRRKEQEARGGGPWEQQGAQPKQTMGARKTSDRGLQPGHQQSEQERQQDYEDEQHQLHSQKAVKRQSSLASLLSRRISTIEADEYALRSPSRNTLRLPPDFNAAAMSTTPPMTPPTTKPALKTRPSQASLRSERGAPAGSPVQLPTDARPASKKKNAAFVSESTSNAEKTRAQQQQQHQQQREKQASEEEKNKEAEKNEAGCCKGCLIM